MRLTLEILIALIGLLLGIGTALSSVIIWYANSEKKKYGVERDFAHIRRNQEQIQQGLNNILLEVDRRFDTVERDILEIKSCLELSQKD